MIMNKGCGNCAVMDTVGEEEACPYLFKCIIYAKKGQEGNCFVPRKKKVLKLRKKLLKRKKVS